MVKSSHFFSFFPPSVMRYEIYLKMLKICWKVHFIIFQYNKKKIIKSHNLYLLWQHLNVHIFVKVLCLHSNVCFYCWSETGKGEENPTDPLTLWPFWPFKGNQAMLLVLILRIDLEDWRLIHFAERMQLNSMCCLELIIFPNGWIISDLFDWCSFYKPDVFFAVDWYLSRILPHKVKTQYLHLKSHAEYSLLSWEIPEMISRRSILFHN